MTTYARCTTGIIVPAYDIKTDKGYRARKDQEILAGQVIQVERQYTCTSLAYHGDSVLVLARDGYHLHVLARHFQVFELTPEAPRATESEA